MAFVINVNKWLLWTVETMYIAEFIIPFWNHAMCETQCGLSTLLANTRRLPNASCLLIAAGLVVLTAGGDYKPTLTQCMQAAKWMYLLISQVCILPSFGRAVTGTAADSETEVSAYFTSVLIPSFGRTVTGKRERSDAIEKEVQSNLVITKYQGPKKIFRNIYPKFALSVISPTPFPSKIGLSIPRY